MTPETVHLTAQTVAKDIASAIAAAPKYPYRAVFSIPYYRRQLIVRVVKCLHSYYAVGDRQHTDQPADQPALLSLLERPKDIRQLIRGHMARVLAENWGWADSSQLPDSSPVFYATVNRDVWFQ